MTSINTTRDKTAQFVVDHHGHRVWEFQGGCLAPPRLWVRGLPDPVLEKDKKPVMGWMMVRCRKCPDCLEHLSLIHI